MTPTSFRKFLFSSNYKNEYIPIFVSTKIFLEGIFSLRLSKHSISTVLSAFSSSCVFIFTMSSKTTTLCKKKNNINIM